MCFLFKTARKNCYYVCYPCEDGDGWYRKIIDERGNYIMNTGAAFGRIGHISGEIFMICGI